MTTEEFLRIANEKISDNPFKRLTPATRALVEQPNCLFDVHCHIFDRKCINIPYFLLRLIGTLYWRIVQAFVKRKGPQSLSLYMSAVVSSKNPEAFIYDQLRSPGLLQFNEEDEWEHLEDLFDAIETENKVNGFSGATLLSQESISGLWETLMVLLKGSMKRILARYMRRDAVTTLPEYKKHPFVPVVLLMDLEQGWGARTRRSYRDQVTKCDDLARKEPMLPFFALDPRRQDLYELFLDAFTRTGSTYFGIKLYPSFGYSPADYRLYPFWEVCSKKSIPVLTHCGGHTISTFDPSVTVSDCSDGNSTNCKPRVVTGTRIEMANQLNDPTPWSLVLAKFPNLKLNLGHFGGIVAWKDPHSDLAKRLPIIEKQMSCPNVYADFSFNLTDSNLDTIFRDGLTKNQLFANRATFGTDYWVVLPQANLADSTSRFLRNMQQFSKPLLTDNPKKWLFN